MAERKDPTVMLVEDKIIEIIHPVRCSCGKIFDIASLNLYLRNKESLNERGEGRTAERRRATAKSDSHSLQIGFGLVLPRTCTE